MNCLFSRKKRWKNQDTRTEDLLLFLSYCIEAELRFLGHECFNEVVVLHQNNLAVILPGELVFSPPLSAHDRMFIRVTVPTCHSLIGLRSERQSRFWRKTTRPFLRASLYYVTLCRYLWRWLQICRSSQCPSDRKWRSYRQRVGMRDNRATGGSSAHSLWKRRSLASVRQRENVTFILFCYCICNERTSPASKLDLNRNFVGHAAALATFLVARGQCKQRDDRLDKFHEKKPNKNCKALAVEKANRGRSKQHPYRS